MNKKGFILIEIIISLALLFMIPISSLLFFKKFSTEEKTNKKIVKNILATADVYYSLNNEIQKETNNNYGYYVLTIDALNREG